MVVHMIMMRVQDFDTCTCMHVYDLHVKMRKNTVKICAI